MKYELESTVSFNLLEYQGNLNNCKDEIINRINLDHGLNLDPCEYMYVAHTKGSVGRFWEKLMAKFGIQPPEKDRIHYLLVRTVPPKPAEPKKDAESKA